jgi:hypothetical protein
VLALGLLVVGPAPAAPNKANAGATRQGKKRGDKKRGRSARAGPVFNGSRLVSQSTLARLRDGTFPLRLGGGGGVRVLVRARGGRVVTLVVTDRRGERVEVRQSFRDGRVFFNFSDPSRGPTSLFFPAAMVAGGPPDRPAAKGGKEESTAPPPAKGGEESRPPTPARRDRGKPVPGPGSR